MVRILKAVDIGILADLKLAKSEELSSQEDINIIKILSKRELYLADNVVNNIYSCAIIYDR